MGGAGTCSDEPSLPRLSLHRRFWVEISCVERGGGGVTSLLESRTDGWVDGRADGLTGRQDKEHMRRLRTSTAYTEEKAVVFAAAYSWQDQAGSTYIILASAPRMFDCRRDDPPIRI